MKKKISYLERLKDDNILIQKNFNAINEMLFIPCNNKSLFSLYESDNTVAVWRQKGSAHRGHNFKMYY